MIDRRAFLTSTLALLAAPLAAEAQPAGKIPRIGFLGPGPIADWSDTREAFRQGLRALGYVEGQNIRIEWRFTDSGYEGLPDTAAELVQLNPDVIVTVTTPAARAAKGATKTIPIVMSGVARPVELGLVATMARPGGNATGITNNPGLGMFQKQLQLLKEAAPKIARVAVLMTAGEPELADFGALRDAGQALGVTAVSVTVDSPTSFAPHALTRVRPDALYVFPNRTNAIHMRAILDFAATNRLPTIYAGRDWVTAGGLMSYNADWLAMRRRAAAFVVKILNGTKPADIPVEDPTTFTLVVNLKTAKAIGLTIPPSVLARADEVIE
jgi:putative tryptophan/tyrosine transport system substrate-binding protein